MVGYGKAKLTPLFKVSVISLALKSLSVEDFTASLASFIKNAKDSNSQLVLLPEYAFAPIISICNGNVFEAAKITGNIIKALSAEHEIIISWGGVELKANKKCNIAYLYVGNQLIEQPKLHLIESEKQEGFFAGDSIRIINLNSIKLAILVCYDIEFPELVRILKENQVQIILVPSYTIDNFGANRVSICCKARAIENHLYVLKSCLIGDEGNIKETPCGKGYSSIYCPSDITFNSSGELLSSINEQDSNIIHYELDLNLLKLLNENCSTSPFQDYLVTKKFRYNIIEEMI